ncbi:hypothetical protein HK100_001194 [Physocladia obscura]|uniref:OPA3-like protein n=1 Tax=Physocladia obscura TaxID=109957 RepID=A0AAD5XF12_9FUNG|nr:hypothetical protein HK100_001194 [Physocladia obscura]
MRFLGYKVETIRPLNEARAVELGTSFLAEFVIFSVAGTVVVTETIRSSQATSRRNKHLDDEIESLKTAAVVDSSLLQKLQTRVETVEKENGALRDVVVEFLAAKESGGGGGLWWFVPGLYKSNGGVGGEEVELLRKKMVSVDKQ